MASRAELFFNGRGLTVTADGPSVSLQQRIENGVARIQLDSAGDMRISAAGELPAALVAGAGDDVIDLSLASGGMRAFGGAGDDRMRGGPGEDSLVGGPGADRLTGGPGADRFVISGRDRGHGIDRIEDYETADVIVLEALLPGTAPEALLDRLHLDPDGRLRFDPDGAAPLPAETLLVIEPPPVDGIRLLIDGLPVPLAPEIEARLALGGVRLNLIRSRAAARRRGPGGHHRSGGKPMRIVTFDKSGTATLGIARGDSVVDLSRAAPELPRSLPGLLAEGPAALAQARSAAEAAKAADCLAEAELHYLPPVTAPGKILCLGLNYRDHAIESGQPIPTYPVVFMRAATTLAGHRQAMVRPRASEQFDYEAELAVVIGKRARHVDAAQALAHVAGYSCFNDGSVRDFQFKGPQWTMGKNFDASGGFGPALVTADELPPGAAGLRIACRLNGETLQDSNTDQHIFDVPTAVATISEVMTLLPGDVIVMGTPPGVGVARKPPVWMKAGDRCEIEIEGIGTLHNPIQDEGAS